MSYLFYLTGKRDILHCLQNLISHEYLHCRCDSLKCTLGQNWELDREDSRTGLCLDWMRKLDPPGCMNTLHCCVVRAHFFLAMVVLPHSQTESH